MAYNAGMAHSDDLLEYATPGTRTRNKREAKQRLTELDGQLAERLRKDDIDAMIGSSAGLLDALDSSKAEERISAVTGRPAPSAQEEALARKQNLYARFELRHRLLRDALTVSEVAKLLGTTRQTPHDRCAAGTLLAVKDRGHWRFPVWQFDPEGPDGVLDGLTDALAALPRQTPIGRVLWFVTPKQQLQGRSPVEALRDGEVPAVVAEAQAVHAR